MLGEFSDQLFVEKIVANNLLSNFNYSLMLGEF